SKMSPVDLETEQARHASLLRLLTGGDDVTVLPGVVTRLEGKDTAKFASNRRMFTAKLAAAARQLAKEARDLAAKPRSKPGDDKRERYFVASAAMVPRSPERQVSNYHAVMLRLTVEETPERMMTITHLDPHGDFADYSWVVKPKHGVYEAIHSVAEKEGYNMYYKAQQFDSCRLNGLQYYFRGPFCKLYSLFDYYMLRTLLPEKYLKVRQGLSGTGFFERLKGDFADEATVPTPKVRYVPFMKLHAHGLNRNEPPRLRNVPRNEPLNGLYNEIKRQVVELYPGWWPDFPIVKDEMELPIHVAMLVFALEYVQLCAAQRVAGMLRGYVHWRKQAAVDRLGLLNAPLTHPVDKFAALLPRRLSSVAGMQEVMRRIFSQATRFGKKQYRTMFVGETRDNVGAALKRIMDGRPLRDLPRKLSLHQMSVFIAARAAALHTLDMHETPARVVPRGHLVYHNTGAGKTIAVAAVITAFWDTPMQIVFATTDDNLRGNTIELYVDNLIDFFPTYYVEEDDRKQLADPKADPAVKQHVRQHVFQYVKNQLLERLMWSPYTTSAGRNRMHTGYDPFTTYSKLANLVGLGLNPMRTNFAANRLRDAVVIFDEAHELYSADAAPQVNAATGAVSAADQQKAALYKFLQVMKDTNKEATMLPSMPKWGRKYSDWTNKNTHFVLLTATPGDSVEKIDAMMESLTAPGFPPMVSAADARADLSSWAKVQGPRAPLAGGSTNFRVPMNKPHFENYIRKLPDALKESTGKVRARPYQFSRLGGLKEAHAKYVEKLSLLSTIGPAQASAKLRKLEATVLALEGKQYIYSYHYGQNFKRTPQPVPAAEVCRMLRRNGHELLTATARDDGNNIDAQVNAWYAARPAGAKPLVMVVGKVSSAFRSLVPSPGAVFGADGSAKDHTEHFMGLHKGIELHHKLRMALFNDKRNANGEHIKFVVATDDKYQGFDVKTLRGVHIFDPLPTALQNTQAWGRGPRFRSHIQLEVEKWNVTIYRYTHTAPQGNTAALPAIGESNGGKGPVVLLNSLEQVERLVGYAEKVLKDDELIDLAHALQQIDSGGEPSDV
ncbi:MAG: DEAD/DEAH box helicase family protein, partial [Rubrivivax sp.]